MNCNTYRPLISDYTDGQLGEAERTQVQAHLQVCPACAQVAADFRALSGLLGGLPLTQTSAQFETRLAERLARAHRPTRLWGWLAAPFSPPRSLLRPALALGAACGVVAGAAFFTHTPAAVETPVPSAGEPALVSHCLQQHRSYVAAQPLSDLAAQNLANQLDETGSAPATALPEGSDL